MPSQIFGRESDHFNFFKNIYFLASFDQETISHLTGQVKYKRIYGKERTGILQLELELEFLF